MIDPVQIGVLGGEDAVFCTAYRVIVGVGLEGEGFRGRRLLRRHAAVHVQDVLMQMHRGAIFNLAQERVRAVAV